MGQEEKAIIVADNSTAYRNLSRALEYLQDLIKKDDQKISSAQKRVLELNEKKETLKRDIPKAQESHTNTICECTQRAKSKYLLLLQSFKNEVDSIVKEIEELRKEESSLINSVERQDTLTLSELIIDNKALLDADMNQMYQDILTMCSGITADQEKADKYINNQLSFLSVILLKAIVKFHKGIKL